jgi:hypothetical protein
MADYNSSGKLKSTLAVGGVALLTFVVALVVLYNLGPRSPRGRHAEVAARGGKVMPFDLAKTKHMFQLLPDGGLQTVTVIDFQDNGHIGLVQAHLKEEAAKFQNGDFSDPARIHGEDMPGLAELKVGAKHISIRYNALANGGEIRYTTSNPELIHAIHRWFMAQLADHGKHATSH